MNKDDEIREELSDLWCKEITGQLKGSEKIRLQNLIEEREFPFPDRKRWLARLRQKEEFDSAIAYRKFLQYKNRKRWWRFGRIGLTAAAAVLLIPEAAMVVSVMMGMPEARASRPFDTASSEKYRLSL